MPNCILIGAPIDEGQRRPGCVMGPAAYRVAGASGFGLGSALYAPGRSAEQVKKQAELLVQAFGAVA